MDRAETVVLLCVFLIAAAGCGVEASVHVYSGDRFRELGNAYLLAGGSEGIVGSRFGSSGGEDVPAGVRDGRAFIRFEKVIFWRSKEASSRYSPMEHSTGLVQAILFEAKDRDNIGGSAYGGQKSICCTPDLAKIESCQPGEILRTPSSADLKWPYIINTFFSANYTSTEMEESSISITRTGMYNLFFITCDPRLRGLKMSGRTVWKNPSGYLPGRMAPLMTFYMFMLLAHVILIIIWSAQYIRFRKDILQIQNFISIVIVLGFLEMGLWYFEFLNFNNTGERPMGITLSVVTVGALRKTISRVLILVVSMGFGVVRPTLGGLTSKVVFIGVTYFLATEALDIVENVGTVSDSSGKGRVLFVLPKAFLDAFLILWIFTSLSRTLENLQAKRSSSKLDTYRKFTNALALSVFASVAWIGYEVYFKATDIYSERWQTAWIITAFWDILAFSLLCVICYLWGPSQNSRRYAYSDELGEDADNEEAQLLTRAPEVEIAMVKHEKREVNSVDRDAFSLEDEPEEDKIE